MLRNNYRATLVTSQRPGRASTKLPAHLSDAERGALGTIAARLEPIDARIETLILFGSRARGESRWNSDLDLAVRVRGQRDAALERRIIAAMAEVEWSAPLDGALRISPLVFFQGERHSAIHEVIAEEGVTVWQTPA
ncbi:MAG: nucleotidyltransferase domain-containing protein [Betaproteobacteria bacterium]|nr:nucleotidyltransferase domain-containing protein [Betaproteobacteria bacterium]